MKICATRNCSEPATNNSEFCYTHQRYEPGKVWDTDVRYPGEDDPERTTERERERDEIRPAPSIDVPEPFPEIEGPSVSNSIPTVSPFIIAGLKSVAVLVLGFFGVQVAAEQLGNIEAIIGGTVTVIYAVLEYLKTVKTQRKIAAAAETTTGLPK